MTPVMTPRITVLNVRNVYAYGGSDTALLGWCGAIDRTAFNAPLALFANADGAEQQTFDRAKQLGIETFLIPGGRRRRLWTSVRALVRLVREQRAHILHLHDVKSDLVGLIAARITGLPAIGSAYAWFGGTSLLRARIYERLDLSLLRRCEYVLAISDTVRQQSIDLGLPPAKVVTMFSGIDYDAFQVTIDRPAVRQALGAEPGDLLLGNIARLFPEKDQSTLLRAMPSILRELPQARLVIVGDGPLLAALREEADRLSVSARVTFAGFRRDLAEVLQALDLQVHSSIKEGLPVAVCSGMAAGLPVVSTDIDGVAEVITPGVTGMLVPPGDPAGLADAIVTVLKDPGLARTIAANGQRRMRDEFRLSHVVGKLEGIYREVHRRAAGRRRRA